MRFSSPLAGLLLQVGLSLAKPHVYEKNGIVYNNQPRDIELDQKSAAHQARGLDVRQAACLGSYELVATGVGASPTGTPDPNFDFFTFCSAYIRPTKTYTVTLRSSTPPPVVTVTVTNTRSSARPTPTSTSEGPIFVTVTVTSTRSSTKPTITFTISAPTSTSEPPIFVTVTVTSIRSSTKPVSTITDEGPVFVTVTITKISTKSSSTSIKPTLTSEPPDIITVTVTASNYSPYKPPTTSTPLPPTSITTSSKPPVTTSTTSLGITRTQLTTSSTSKLSTTSSSQVVIPPTTTRTQQPAATGTLCPSPHPSQTCAIAGWGYAENNLYSGSPVSASQCSQLCLTNPDCKSYQTQDSTFENPQCNLYRVEISSTSVIPGAAPYLFYDRGCLDFAPITCTKTTSPQTTAQPTISVGFGDVIEKRQGIKTLPWFLEPFDPIIISEVCSCIITVAPPAIGYTMTIGG